MESIENMIPRPVNRTVKAGDTPLAFVLDVLDTRLEHIQDSERPREDMCQLRLEVRQLRATLSEHAAEAQPCRAYIESWAKLHYPAPVDFELFEEYYRREYAKAQREKWIRA